METNEDKKLAHPCFNEDAKHTSARVHLPVAPKCNIQCNYCNRKYDCVNESRPGVTSSVLAPFQAVEYLKDLDSRMDNLAVIGIAGPGDPFANAEETLETMRRVNKEFPDKIFCLSSNGLELEQHIDELAELNVTHVTITINAIDPEITAKIYKWVRFNKKVYRGVEGAKILLDRQLACIPKLKAAGITVKINSIIIPGINEDHIPAVAKKCAELGADVINCIPLIPTAETPFETVEKPDTKMIFRTRTLCSEHLKIMSHCARCRADAAGLLGQDMKETHALLASVAAISLRARAVAMARPMFPAPMMPMLGMMMLLSFRDQAVRPPSATMSAPVTKAASSLARKATMLAISDGWP